MHEIDRSVLVNYSAEQLFELVDRVEDYPKFLPWCGGTVVQARDDGKTRAAITIDFKGIKQRFSTENSKTVPHHIEMRLIEGPFRKLDGSWHFLPLGDHACKVQFRLRYEFASRLLEKLVGPVFDHIAATFVDAFVKRAGEVYETVR
ncbi:MAG: ubiquinone-binding protein [Betaproteobacteria bacterium]|nr:ubiquinone-binding protein [Betaproteobacteria bacterium]